MPIPTDAAFILPDDFADAALMGRVFRPDFAGPAVVTVRTDGVFDITDTYPTASQLAATADPAAALRAAQGQRLGSLQDVLTNTPTDNRDPTRPWLLAPIDLQVIKAAGVTFAISMLERVIEERARGNPDSAAAIRAEVTQENHQYPDGFVLFLGTAFAPIQDRSAKGQGLTHVEGDLVTIATPRLGRLVNRMRKSGDCERWEFGLTALITALTRRRKAA